MSRRSATTSVWVADSQMLFSDCYAVLALAARQTTRLRIGPGTAICGTRIPPVQVAAMATLNRLAPGRVFLGIGTGNTAMRSMGQRPMRIAEFAEYLRVLAALLRGEMVDYAFNGVTRPISMLMHDCEVHEPRAEDPALRLRLRAARDGAGRRIRRRPRLRHPAARRRRSPRRSAHVRQGAARGSRDLDGFAIAP